MLVLLVSFLAAKTQQKSFKVAYYSYMKFLKHRLKGIVFAAVVVVVLMVFYANKSKIENLVSSNKTGTSKKATVKKNTDGDTLSVETANGEVLSVRLIGIDTPETKRPGVSVECGGPQASAALKKLAPPGTEVKLITDPTQTEIDRYGRTLGYLYLINDSVSLNEKQLAAGWAEIYVYDNNRFKEYESFEKAAEEAQKFNRGNYRICGGNFHSAS